jgi:hypothetical protein
VAETVGSVSEEGKEVEVENEVEDDERIEDRSPR